MIAALALLLQAATSALPSAADPHKPTRVEREFSGVWLDEFEAQQFFDGAEAGSALPPFGSAPWLDIDRARTLLAMLPPAIARARTAALYEPRLYRIRFVGAIAPAKDCRQRRDDARGIGMLPPPTPECVGTGGMFPGEVAVKRVLSLEDIGPLPRGGQPFSFSSGNPR